MFIRAIEHQDWKVTKDWVPISRISRNLQLSVIASEDQRFLNHFGFDLDAIQKAIEYNQKRAERKSLRGASTISQQTAKNVFLWNHRSWFRKALEVYFTTLIEVFWTKERILEVYLNIVEMGPGVYGAQAASKYYFQKNADQLSLYEASFIASILPNPISRKIYPWNPPSYIQKRQTWILGQLSRIEREYQ